MIDFLIGVWCVNSLIITIILVRLMAKMLSGEWQ
jgi:hypothetical protein